MLEAPTPIAVTGHDAGLLDALAWLARLPLLTDAQLGRLLGRDGNDASMLLRRLRQQGHAARIMLDSPEFSQSLALHYATTRGIAVWSECVTRHAPKQPIGCLPLSTSELLARVARAETAVGIADLLAMLAADLRRTPAGDGAAGRLVDAATTWWAPHRGERSGLPPAVDAWGRLRVGGMQAGFLLAWDRAGAPRAHRRAWVSAWYGADRAPWGDDPAGAPVLIVCPSVDRLAEWDTLLDRSAARRGRDRLRCALTTVADLTGGGPLGRVWRRTADGAPVELFTVLVWQRAASPGTRTTRVPTLDECGRRHPECRQTITREARRGPREAPPSGIIRGRWTTEVYRAALAISLGATEKTIIEWVAHHPLLPVAHLALHLALPDRRVASMLDRLARFGVIQVDRTPGFRDVGPRYVLTERGAGLLAARDGVPLHRYLREGGIAADGPAAPPSAAKDTAATLRPAAPWQIRLADLRRRPVHTGGVQQFALALTREAAWRREQGQDHRLLAWINAVEGQQWFADGRQSGHIWPDARFHYRMDGVVYDVLLEWDRGLGRRRDYARKFDAYAAFLAGRPVDHGGADGIMRVIVATPTGAAGRVQQAIEASTVRCPRLATVTRVITFDVVRQARITDAFP